MLKELTRDKIVERAKEHGKEIVDSLKVMLGLDDATLADNAILAELQTDAFSHLLPYLGWDDTSGLFILDKGENVDKKDRKKHSTDKLYLGFVLECSPQVGATDTMEEILQSIYLQSPTGTSISVHNYASPNFLPILKEASYIRFSDKELGIDKEHWEKRNVNIFQTMMRERTAFFLQGTMTSIFKGSTPFLIKDHRVIISVVVPFQPDSPNGIDDAMLLKEQVSATLASGNMSNIAWKPQDLINFVQDFFDHERMKTPESRIDYQYNEIEKIRTQCVGRDIETKITPNTIEFENNVTGLKTDVISLSVVQYPSNFHLAMMGAMIGDYFQEALGYPCPYMITTSTVVQDYDAMRSRAQIKTATASRKTEGYMAKIDPLIPEEAFEWKNTLKAIEDGGTLIKMMTNITLVAPKAESKKVFSEVNAIWRSKGFRLARERYQQLVSFLSVMPMSLTPPLVKDLEKMKKFSTKYSQNAVSLSPYIGDWKGTKTPVLNFISKRGQLTSFDFFDNEAGNYNYAIVGTSGSGKSFVTQEILMSYRSTGALVWVIDVGRSYMNLCDLLDGQFIEFGPDSDIVINPFSEITDINEEMDMLKPLVAQMISPSGKLDDWQLASIEVGIRRVHEKFGSNMTITDLANFFNEYASESPQDSQRMRDIGHMLFPWTKFGAYGKYFNGKTNINLSNPFTVLELEELKSKVDLQAVILMIMMYYITNEMYMGERSQKKICMIDEAWSILSGSEGDHIAKFVEVGYRRARKYGGSFGTATQNYLDYYKSAGALAALQNADWTITLRQKSDSVDVLKEKGLMGIDSDPFKERTIRGLKKEDGKYSEMYVYSPVGEGAVRFVAEKFTQILYSSKADDFAKIQQFKKDGLSVEEAVQKLMEMKGVKYV